MEFFTSGATSWFGLLGSIGLLLATNVARKYVIPFLKIGKRQKYATYIAQIANDVTDDLRAAYPDKVWLRHLDEAIDRLVAICEVSPEIAQRAINAAVGRWNSAR